MYAFAALALLSASLQSAPLLQCHADQSYDGPRSIDRPAALHLPVAVTDTTAMSYGRGIQLTGGIDATGPMLMHSGGITGFRAAVAYLAEDDSFVAVMVNDSSVPAEAALWALVRAARARR